MNAPCRRHLPPQTGRTPAGSHREGQSNSIDGASSAWTVQQGYGSQQWLHTGKPATSAPSHGVATHWWVSQRCTQCMPRTRLIAAFAAARRSSVIRRHRVRVPMFARSDTSTGGCWSPAGPHTFRNNLLAIDRTTADTSTIAAPRGRLTYRDVPHGAALPVTGNQPDAPRDLVAPRQWFGTVPGSQPAPVVEQGETVRISREPDGWHAGGVKRRDFRSAKADPDVPRHNPKPSPAKKAKKSKNPRWCRGKEGREHQVVLGPHPWSVRPDARMAVCAECGMQEYRLPDASLAQVYPDIARQIELATEWCTAGHLWDTTTRTVDEWWGARIEPYEVTITYCVMCGLRQGLGRPLPV